jgi:hypothetical protein
MVKHHLELTAEQEKLIAVVKAGGDAIMLLLDYAGQSREGEIAKTKIKEAVMWSIKHLTR